MEKIIMGISLGQRMQTVLDVQNILSEFGCYIQTRLGLHQTSEDACSNHGLILVEFLNNTKDKAIEMEKKLSKIADIQVKTMEF
ncbi:MAG: hypothetical protein PHT34_04315 [Oscillospiraceae bacterium]|nr:hypothetical protein [Oscillospiraceae bacterium]